MRLISLVGPADVQSSSSVAHYLGVPEVLSAKSAVSSLLPRPDFLNIEETSEGFFLYRYPTRRQEFGGDTWHPSQEEAQEQAAFEQGKSSRWPGTELLGAEADLFYCRLNAESAHLIKNATGHLYGWCHPNLPEDLCLLRNDREPWLVTITHEQDRFLVLTELERHHLLLLMPALRLSAT